MAHIAILESLPNNISVLSYHTATRYQNLMIIAFGEYNTTATESKPTKEIRIFDITNGAFKWLQNYVVPLTPTVIHEIPVTPAPQKNPKNLALIIGVPLASIGLIFLGSAFVFILYRRRSTKANNIQGNTTNNQAIKNPRI
ncbi:hypothetical protein G9A89_004939 [Geosiphon pyriformis]|nr:hypothetical protein G9A89_004939 [Geosiphon pyriformis]